VTGRNVASLFLGVCRGLSVDIVRGKFTCFGDAVRVGSLLMVLPDALRGHWSLGSLPKCKPEVFYNEEAARLGLVHHSAHATFLSMALP